MAMPFLPSRLRQGGAGAGCLGRTTGTTDYHSRHDRASRSRFRRARMAAFAGAENRDLQHPPEFRAAWTRSKPCGAGLGDLRPVFLYGRLFFAGCAEDLLRTPEVPGHEDRVHGAVLLPVDQSDCTGVSECAGHQEIAPGWVDSGLAGSKAMMMLTAALLIILSMPLCASVAGTLVWVAHRNETADDSELLKHFLVALIVAMTILWS